MLNIRRSESDSDTLAPDRDAEQTVALSEAVTSVTRYCPLVLL